MNDLPRDLDDGLLLRWATADDADELAAFNVRIHSDDPKEPEEWLGHWTRDLLGGRHPTTGPEDVTVVTDAEGRIVSSVALISQTWEYAGIPVAVGQPELVGTDAEHRRRGLCDVQMDAIHERSAARGQTMQAIMGIPWFYRRYGYEMGLDLRGPRRFIWAQPGNEGTVKEEPFRLRDAGEEDIEALLGLYRRNCEGCLVWRPRDEVQLRWELAGAHEESWHRRRFRIVETPDGEVAGYAVARDHGHAFFVHEVAAAEGRSLRAIALFLTRELKRRADEMNEGRKKPIRFVSFGLGEGHAAHEALGEQLTPDPRPYAWYVRVPDLAGFLRHVAPALERRLARSVMAGHTGKLRVECYRSRFAIEFEEGRLVDVGTFAPKSFGDADALFPDLTFLKLLFGNRSLAQLMAARADCYSKNEDARILLNILFPPRPSRVIPLG